LQIGIDERFAMATLKQVTNERSDSLFPLAANFRIVRLGEADARLSSDRLKTLTDLVGASEDMYPGIHHWLSEKVIPGLRSSQRAAWVAYEGEEPIAAAILKLGEKAKFCHLRIRHDFQDMDLGSAPLKVVRLAALEHLPALAKKFNVSGYALGGDLLVSMKPQYAERILSGSKLVEIRRKFSERWIGCKAVLYSSSPQQALVGEATVCSITTGTPEAIWTRFHAGLGCTRDEFSAYVGQAAEVRAIELNNIFPYKQPISLSEITYLLGLEADLKPPQTYCHLRLDRDQSAWAKAAAVASVLHGCYTHSNLPRA
jgi:predicted transcriptional regulator